MDDSINPNDQDYGLSLNPSTSMGRCDSPAAGSNGSAFASNYPTGLHSFNYMMPSSLDMSASFASHDDSCIDTCVGGFTTHGLHRHAYPPVPYSRPRYQTSSVSYPYPLPENTFFPSPATHFDGFMYNNFMSNHSDLKYSSDLGERSLHQQVGSSQQIGDTFNGNNTNFAAMRQQPVTDDCVSVNCSQVSCSSQCCSTLACEEEDCADDGVPCDDLHCFDDNDASGSLDHIWNMPDDWNSHAHAEPSFLSHNPPCNHTNAEHDVAITLRNLGAPSASGSIEQPDCMQFPCPDFGQVDYMAQTNGSLRPALEETPPLMPDTADTSPKTPEPDDCLKSPNCADQQHTCRWIVSDEGAKHEHLCSRSFSTPIDLDKHLREDHLAHMSSKTKYKCLWKGCVRKDHQEFASRNKLRRHLSTHTSYKPFECKQCGEGFSAQQALDQHIRIHTGDKPYVCDVEGCDKAFKQKSALTMHKRTHTGEKPLVCEYCGKRFCESSNLSKHRKIHNPVYKHKCTEPGCGKEFIRLDQLRRHTEKHERQRKKTKDRLQRATPPELSIQVEPLYII